MIAQIYMRPAHLIRINTIPDDQMVELSEHFGINYRKGFLNSTKELNITNESLSLKLQIILIKVVELLNI